MPSRSFKAWLQQVAQKAAEAAAEGGFLGFGGVAVSEAERATLTEIASALGQGQRDDLTQNWLDLARRLVPNHGAARE